MTLCVVCYRLARQEGGGHGTMNDDNLESKALCKVQKFHECSFCSTNRRHAAGKLLVYIYNQWVNHRHYRGHWDGVLPTLTDVMGVISLVMSPETRISN